MENDDKKQSIIYTIIGALIVLVVVLLISVFVYVKHQNDLKKEIAKEKEIARKVVSSIEYELGKKMNSGVVYFPPATCEINEDGNICHNKERNDTYTINVGDDKKPSGGLIKLTSTGISNSSTVRFKERIYTLQIDGTFELSE